MKINGKELLDSSSFFEDILLALESAPSAFSAYPWLHPDYTKPWNESLKAQFEQALGYYSNKNFTQALELLEKTLKEHTSETENFNKVFALNIIIALGETYREMANGSAQQPSDSTAVDYHGKALQAFKEALKEAIEVQNDDTSNHLTFLCSEITKLYQKSGKLTEYKGELLNNLQNIEQKTEQLRSQDKVPATREALEELRKTEILTRKQLAAIAEYQNDTEAAIKHRFRLCEIQEGSIETGVTEIGQQQFGISKGRMGTYNIHQCTVILIRDPKTSKAALVHFDDQTSYSSLESVIEKFGKTPLTVRIIGSRYSSGDKQTSEDNIEAVLNVLTRHSNIDIISADILNRPAPICLVYNPKDNTVTYGRPIEEDADSILRNSIRIILQDAWMFRKRQLKEVCDANDSSPFKKPVFLTKETLSKLCPLSGYTLLEIYEKRLTKYPELSREVLAYDSVSLSRIIEANNNETADLAQKISNRLQAIGIPFDSQNLKKELLQEEKVIGNFAKENNGHIIQDYADRYILSEMNVLINQVNQSLGKEIFPLSEELKRTKPDYFSPEAKKHYVDYFVEREQFIDKLVPAIHRQLEKYPGILIDPDQLRNDILSQIPPYPNNPDFTDREMFKRALSDIVLSYTEENKKESKRLSEKIAQDFPKDQEPNRKKLQELLLAVPKYPKSGDLRNNAIIVKIKVAFYHKCYPLSSKDKKHTSIDKTIIQNNSHSWVQSASRQPQNSNGWIR